MSCIAGQSAHAISRARRWSGTGPSQWQLPAACVRGGCECPLVQRGRPSAAQRAMQRASICTSSYRASAGSRSSIVSGGVTRCRLSHCQRQHRTHGRVQDGGGAHSRPASVGDQARATAAPASEAEGRPAHRGGRARSLHSSRGPAHRRHWQARRARDRRLCRRGGLRALGGPRGHGAGAGSARVPDAPCVVRGPRRTGRAAGRRATPVCAGGLDSS